MFPITTIPEKLAYSYYTSGVIVFCFKTKACEEIRGELKTCTNYTERSKERYSQDAVTARVMTLRRYSETTTGKKALRWK